jgi:DNA topoisomerase-1
MRTDSLNLSEEAITAAQEFIVSSYGLDFHQARRYKTKSSSAQEAHEAIRPTDLTRPSILGLDDQSAKLYSLIYKRTLASQMSDAELQKTKINIDISNRNEHFIADGEVLSFSGFLKVYDYMAAEDKLLPRLDVGGSLSLVDLISRESFSRAKPRYTEASLVKEIEQMGIGRPSTFATMITTVQDRNYVIKESREGVQRDYQQIEIVDGVISESTQSETTGVEKNKLFPTSVAYILVDFLLNNFRNIIDYEFTANLESDFDKIAEESKPWTGVVRNFYDPFHKQIELAKDVSRDEPHG